MFQMPQKYPVGIQDFAELRAGGYTYIDKTPYIHELTSLGKYYFLSRPRRFGKSLLMSTIAELYKGRKDLFKGLYIEDKHDFSQTNPVVYIPLNGFGKIHDNLIDMLQASMEEHAETYGVELVANTVGVGYTFKCLIQALHQKTGRKVVVLIDEYDKPLVDYLDQPEIAAENRDILKGFYGILKPCDPHLEFVLLTGISRFSKIGIFSDLNNLNDISTQQKYGCILGISQTELMANFEPDLRILAERSPEKDYDLFLQKVKFWYNGYLWNPNESVYNPFSMLNFFASEGEFKNYWFASGTPTFLVKDLESRGMYQLNQLKASEFTLENLEIEKPDPVTLLYQAGYLTVVSQKRSTCTLDFPNQEVRQSFTTLMLDKYSHSPLRNGLPLVEQMLDAFEDKDLPLVFQALNSLFSTIPYQLWEGGEERFYHALTHLTFQLLGVYVKSEVCTSRGRCDALIETDKYVYALEFKLNGSAKAALQQVHDKGYLQPYARSGKELIAVGVNFTTEAKGVVEWLVDSE